jgi:sigma-B regulation protein RsbU (phosphoserine phosphatase)
MLAMILIPLLLLRWNAQSGMQEMGNELAGVTRDAMVQKAREELKIIVEEHSKVLRRERELIEMIIQFQAAELEKWITNNNGSLFVPTGFMRAAEAEPPATRSKLMGNGRMHTFPVFYDRIAYRSSGQGHGRMASTSDSMVSIYKQLAIGHPDLVFWQITVFGNGLQTVYPGVNRFPMRFEPTETDWYRNARQDAKVVWGRPAPDPFTKRFQLTAAKAFHDPAGNTAGVTAIAVPVGELLKNDRHFDYVSKRMKALLVDNEPIISDNRKGLRIIAAPYRESESRHRWWELKTDEWIDIADDRILNPFVADIKANRAGVLDMMYNGLDSLMAYSNIDEYGTALVLIAPKEDVMVEALAMEDMVLERIARQIRLTGLILLAVLVVAGGLAFFLSRSITSNIDKLVEAARRVAGGDFSTRANIRANDEMGELGRTFDRMVPALEDRIKIKQSLDLAMEVQQNLLPAGPPQVDGLDIAAASIYCDETGGDFYDFPTPCCGNNPNTSIAVGDVAGHGISAALLMASARAFLRCRITQPGSKPEVVRDVNMLLSADTAGTGQFVTLFYAEIDQSRRTIHWVRAGHDPALLYDPLHDRFEKLDGQGAALGIEDTHAFIANSRDDLSPGQILCIGTDGIWETHNPRGEMFGRQRLKDIIRSAGHLSAEQIMNRILEAVEAFRAGARQEDDITLVVVKIEK